MRVLLIGANGFLGSAVLSQLKTEGHQVAAVTRAKPPAGLASSNISLDLSKATLPERWLPHLRGVEAVINCAGLLQDTPGQSVRLA
jgi:uncharacterized protein YbjT (DUF2867 family)